jgi:hypothetical protein
MNFRIDSWRLSKIQFAICIQYNNRKLLEFSFAINMGFTSKVAAATDALTRTGMGAKLIKKILLIPFTPFFVARDAGRQYENE